MSEWRVEAECRGTSTSLFFPGLSKLDPEQKYHVNQQAIEICESCAVMEECLEYAVTHPLLVLNGTWGGKTFNQIKAVRRRRDRKVQSVYRDEGIKFTKL